MGHHHFNFILFAVFAFIFFPSTDAFSHWETGVKVGYDSNIDRAVEGGEKDSCLTGFLSFIREPDQGSNPDWTLNLSLEGTQYGEYNDLNYAMVTITPGIIFYPKQQWMVNICPFIQTIMAKDEEQSATGFGGEISVMQSWNQTFYTGEYFIYTDSRADIEIYSYREKAAGVFAGADWTDDLWSEISYEFSRGDSFRAVGEVFATEIGKGKSHRYSQAYREYIIKEPVDRYTIGMNMGYQFTRHIFSFINYSYSSYKGVTGTSKVYATTVGIGYSF